MLEIKTRVVIAFISFFAGVAATGAFISLHSPALLSEARINMCLDLYRKSYYGTSAGSFAANCTKEERDFVFRFEASIR